MDEQGLFRVLREVRDLVRKGERAGLGVVDALHSV